MSGRAQAHGLALQSHQPGLCGRSVLDVGRVRWSGVEWGGVKWSGVGWDGVGWGGVGWGGGVGMS